MKTNQAHVTSPPGDVGVANAVSNPLHLLAGQIQRYKPSAIQRLKPNRTDFDSTSVGTEQELSECKVKINDKDRGTLGEVTKEGVRLIEYTTDMGKDGEYTIELRSTATELADPDEIIARKEATQYLIDAIKALPPVNEGLKKGVTQFPGGYTLTVRIAHSITKTGSPIRSGDQVTLGISSEKLGSGADGSEMLEKHATWFKKALAADLNPAGLIDTAKAGNIYAYIASVIIQLAEIVQFDKNLGVQDGQIQGALDEPYVKNQWGVLPRTPPWETLEILEDGDKAKVQQAITNLPAPAHIKKPGLFDAAKKHIRTKLSLAGHLHKGSIQGKHASLFEFRDPPPELQHTLYGALHEQGAPVSAGAALNASQLDAMKNSPAFKMQQQIQEEEANDDDNDPSDFDTSDEDNG